MSFDIPMKTTNAYNRNSINGIGNVKGAVSKNNIIRNTAEKCSSAVLRRGQKIKLSDNRLKFYFGWNVKNPECDLDGSAFMLDSSGKVISDEWFIFYGNPQSPDKSLSYRPYQQNNGAEIDINTSEINPKVQKIVMSVTIYEAFEKNLNFGMTENIYVRIAESSRNSEIARFDIDDCFSSITALVIGEFYRYNNEWRFSAVGSGVKRDLAGFCRMYGVNLA